MPLNPRFIVLHCTATTCGTVDSVRRFHTKPRAQGGRGWADVGYHKLITNPYADSSSFGKPDLELDGKLWNGRDLDRDGNVEEEIGAHVHGWNKVSLGLALFGMAIRVDESGKLSPGGRVVGATFTAAQIRTALSQCREWAYRFEIKFDDVIGHYEVPGVKKTCPDIDMDWFRLLLRTA